MFREVSSFCNVRRRIARQLIQIQSQKLFKDSRCLRACQGTIERAV